MIYEVNLKIQHNILKDFEEWLQGHIRDVLAIDGFLSATWYESIEDQTQDTVTWVMHYELKDQEALERYLATHATRLRQPAIDRFGNKFSASRRKLRMHQRYT